MAIKVGMVSLGCPKNQVDAEIMLYDIKNAGFELVAEPGLADVVIINTCGFIQDAKEESIENILELCQLKKEGQIKKVIVTGCLAERYQQEIAQELPEVDVILGIGSNSKIVESINEALNDIVITDFAPKERLSLSGKRIISNLPFFAYVKIAEGCDNHCSFCAIPSIRGKYRSRTVEDIVSEVEWLCDNGVKEVILVAQDTTRYGEDLYGEPRLHVLLQKLCSIDKLKWIRILYTYPDKITDELLDTIASQEKIVKYLDIPIQHASKNVLKRMCRSGDYETISALINKIRSKVKDIVIRTTVMVGFPGETDDDFEILSKFVKESRFERLGCFRYSAEEGTAASKLKDQIDDDIKYRREESIMNDQMIIAEQFNQSFIGRTIEVVVEGFDKYGECYFGRSVYDAPDIDGKVFFIADCKLSVGDFVKIIVDEVMDYDLIGRVVE